MPDLEALESKLMLSSIALNQMKMILEFKGFCFKPKNNTLASAK